MNLTKTAQGKTLHQTPPEGVPIPFRIASRAARFGAQVLDILITWTGAFLLLFGLLWLDVLNWNALWTLVTLVFFLIRVPYYILTELIWNGRTLGKRILRLRVISLDGRRLTPHQIVARNLMKEAEVFLPIQTLMLSTAVSGFFDWVILLWMVGVLTVPFLNKPSQRLGDMLAGTVVVENPKPRLMPDLSLARAAPELVFDQRQLDVYGRHELQVLEQILRNRPKTAPAIKNLDEVSRAICRRIGFAPVPEGQVAQWDFLMEFYRQQREYLESRNLFGDLREDKNHKKA